MKFHAARPEYGMPVRLVSDGGKWETGFAPATFDRWQVTLGMVECLGIELRWEVLLLVLRILSAVDEAECTPQTIRKLFPTWTRRPIDRAPPARTRPAGRTWEIFQGA